MPDVCDMVIYGYVESYSWFSRAKEKQPEKNSEQWAKTEEQRIRAVVERQVQEAKEQIRGGGTSAWGSEAVDNDFGGGMEW